MEAKYLFKNEELMEADSPSLFPSNRLFKFGDGLFESIRIVNGKICFLNNHINRLVEGMEALKMEVPENYTEEYFLKLINELIEKNEINEGGLVRLSVYRDAEGAYHPKCNISSFILEANPYKENQYRLNEEGLVVDLYPEMKKMVDCLSMYKTSNSLLYIMASLYCDEKNLDDCFLLNTSGTIIEASSSNIFIVSNGVLYTSSLEEGCVAGTMRMNIINLALEHNIKVYEYKLTPQNLLAADEIFLTNAVSGLKWVGSYRSKRYFNDITKKLTNLLNESVASLKLDLEGN